MSEGFITATRGAKPPDSRDSRSTISKRRRRTSFENPQWVRFNIEVKDIDPHQFKVIRFERAVVEFVKVRGAAGIDHRTVVTMSVCIGTERYEGPFTLRDRTKMLYPILLGRRAIEHIGLVDVTRTFTVEPSCR